jgi:hypothetical protein
MAQQQQAIIDGMATSPFAGANAQSNPWDVTVDGQYIGSFIAPYYQHFQLPVNLDPTVPHIIAANTGGWILIAQCVPTTPTGSAESIKFSGGTPGDTTPPDPNTGGPGLATRCEVTGYWDPNDEGTVGPYTNWVLTSRQNLQLTALGKSWAYWWRPFPADSGPLPIVDPRNITNATVLSQPKIPAKKAFSPETKAAFATASQQTGVVAVALGIGSIIFSATGVPGGFLGVISTLLGLTQYALDGVANDPVDTNYTELAVATPYSPLPDLTGAPKCVQNLVNYYAKLWGVANATHTSYNRLLGAVQAGDTYWTNHQASNMHKLGKQLETMVTKLQASPQVHFNCLRPQLQLPVQNIDQARVLANQTTLATSGSPSSWFQGFGLDDQTVQNLTGLFYVQDPALVAAAYNAIFDDPTQHTFNWAQLANGLPTNGGYTITNGSAISLP